MPKHGVTTSKPSKFEVIIKYITIVVIVVTFPISICFCLRVAKEYERIVIFRLGRLLNEARGPGLFFILPCIDTVTIIDLRTVSFLVPPQEVLTKDSVTVQVDAVVFYRVVDPLSAVIKIEYYRDSTMLLSASILRNTIGTRNLTQLLSDKEELSHTIHNTLEEATKPWGVKVERVEIKDVRLPTSLQRAMAAEAEATREAMAKVIAAEGEIKASTNLSEASKIMSDNPMALQLRYLQSLNAIASHQNSTIIFPFPMEFLGAFLKGSGQRGS